MQGIYGCRIADRLGKDCQEGNRMKRFEYMVEDIDGDYAHLRRTDVETEELKLVARALLPPEITEGTKLLYEYMSYSIME